MIQSKLFSDKQFGFISGRSFTLQLLIVMEEWTEILDNGGTLDSIYMDFMKVFDKSPTQKAVKKTEKLCAIRANNKMGRRFVERQKSKSVCE